MEKLHLVSVLDKLLTKFNTTTLNFQAKKDIQSHADSIETSLANIKASKSAISPRTTTATICMVSSSDKPSSTRKKESESSQKGKFNFQFFFLQFLLLFSNKSRAVSKIELNILQRILPIIYFSS